MLHLPCGPVVRGQLRSLASAVTCAVLVLAPGLAAQSPGSTGGPGTSGGGGNSGADGAAGGTLAPGARTGPGGGPQASREATWPPPTVEDWQKPCLITWQRTFEDAQAVSRETGRPILICVNMDGELASEHYAGIVYRRPETAALYDPYVCVIASVYRHTPRDHDENGRRILCPRFGSVTCGEHIAIEPGLYEKYFEGQRVAPRHIDIELDGKETYDVFYAWSTTAVLDTLREGIAKRTTVPPPPVPGDRSLPELVSSHDIRDQDRVELAYQQGDVEQRRALLEAALANGTAPPLELLRLALAGTDPELLSLARRALAQSVSDRSIDLINEALRAPMDAAERDALIAALVRLGEGSPRARALAVAHQGLSGPSAAIDVERWSAVLQAPEPPRPAYDSATVVAPLENQNAVLASEDADAHVELGEALLVLAHAEPDPSSARYLFRDARRAAREAERLGATGGRVARVLALSDFHLGDLDEARAHAEAAMSVVPADAQDRDAAIVLQLFAQARQEAIAKAVREKRDWPSQWLADVHAAYGVLVQHPFGDDTQVLMHHDFLKWFGAEGQAAQVLDEGLARFPDSWMLHDRLRARLLAERGPLGLEAAYEERLRQPGAPKSLQAFAGYASLVIAELNRRTGRADEALAAYDRGVAHYQASVIADDPADAADDEAAARSLDTANHYIAIALAGRARIAFERHDDAAALQELFASFACRPESAATLDGLSVSAVETAKLLLARLRAAGRDEDVARLDGALQALGARDPALLEQPVFERDQPPGPR